MLYMYVHKSRAVRGAAEGEAGGEAREALREGPRMCRWGAEAVPRRLEPGEARVRISRPQIGDGVVDGVSVTQDVTI